MRENGKKREKREKHLSAAPLLLHLAVKAHLSPSHSPTRVFQHRHDKGHFLSFRFMIGLSRQMRQTDTQTQTAKG
ncbi:hypothetical protein E2C01_082064 [Portunus trituberculatus]|uniref:Uncharacterized protein n=1 Tax=Portunus trituberculatus TaxID=210409 RepID=A0A5B7J2S9_PORTR|nr:hypothetical protein [Portunus trituberculatus]